MAVMLGLLSVGEQPRRLLRQLPFDEATEQQEKSLPIGRR